MAKKLTSTKARKILHDKEVHGHPLTEKQRKFFGAIAGGAKPYKAQIGTIITALPSNWGDRLSDVLSFPQRAITKLFTGEYQTPSEAMKIENPWGAMATDMLLDPVNLVSGAGFTKSAKAAKAAPKVVTKSSQKSTQEQLLAILKEQRPSWFVKPSPKDAKTNALEKEAAKKYLKSFVDDPADETLVYETVDPRLVAKAPNYKGMGLNPRLEGGRKTRNFPVGESIFTLPADKFKKEYNIYDLLHDTQYHLRKNKNGGWLDKYDAPQAQTGTEVIKGKDFVDQWMKSPMYKEMLEKSAQGPELERISKGRIASFNVPTNVSRDINLEGTGTLGQTQHRVRTMLNATGPEYEEMMKIMQKSIDNPKDKEAKRRVDEVIQPMITGWNIGLNPKLKPGTIDYEATLAHEYGHTTDNPFVSKFPYQMSRKEAINLDTQTYIPKSDIEKMKAYSQGKVNDDLTKYVSKPQETRQYLNDIRYLGKSQGVYDPFSEKITTEQFKKIQPLQYGNPMQTLRQVYTDEQIIDMLNSISKTQRANDIPVAQNGIEGTMGGLTDVGFNYNGAWGGTMQNGGKSTADSLRHQANKILQYEQLRGGPGGTPLPHYSDPKYMDMLMNSIYPEVKKIMPNASAMEAAEAMDFIFNAGWDQAGNKITKDPRAYALQEYYRQHDPSKLDPEGKWPGRKNAPYSFDQEYNATIGKLPENERRVLMNKGRDWYYKNINNPSPGVPNSNYYDTWYGRIWNTNDFQPFNPNNPKFVPKRQTGGNIIPAMAGANQTVPMAQLGDSVKPIPVQLAMGGSMPGAVGFTYARTAGAAPANGPYAKKTKASAQNGMEMKYYQEGLDFKPKTISQNGSRTPIVVTDPKDPRLKAYQDSLSLYKGYRNYDLDKTKPIEFYDKNDMAILRAMYPNTELIERKPTPLSSYDQWVLTQSGRKTNFKVGKTYSNKELALEQNKAEQYANRQGRGLMKNKGNLILDWKNQAVRSSTIAPIGMGYGNMKDIDNWNAGLVTIYKKPVQPVILEEEPRFEKPIPIPRDTRDLGYTLPTPGQPRFPELYKYSPDTPTKFSFTYPPTGGGYNEQKTMYFPTKSALKSFIEGVRGASYQEGSDYATATGNLKNGGWLDKYDVAQTGINIIPQSTGDLRGPKIDPNMAANIAAAQERNRQAQAIAAQPKPSYIDAADVSESAKITKKAQAAQRAKQQAQQSTALARTLALGTPSGAAPEIGGVGTQSFEELVKAFPQSSSNLLQLATGKQPYGEDKIENVLGTTGDVLTVAGGLASVLPSRAASVAAKAKGASKTAAGPKLSILPSGTYSEEMLTQGRHITQDDIKKYYNKWKSWIQSPEYMQRRTAVTGESPTAIQKDVRTMLDRWKSININVEKPSEDALGEFTRSLNEIRISPELTRKEALPTLEHEVMHALSQMGGIQGVKGYKKYPVVPMGNWTTEFLKPKDLLYFRKPAEQQVRALRALDFIEETQGVKRGAPLTEENIDQFITDVNPGGKFSDYFWTDYNDVGGGLSMMVEADKATKFVPKNLLKGKFPFKFERRGEFKQRLLDQLNKAYTVPGAIGAGAAATMSGSGEQPPQQQDGGDIPVDPMGYWNPENVGGPVIIPSNIITMEGVDQPLLGISDTGDVQYMEPGEDYEFDGEYVTEYPIAKGGVSVNNADAQPLKKLDQLLNFTNYNKPTKGGWLDKYK